MRKFSSSNVYRPFLNRKAGQVKNFLMDIADKLNNDLVSINPTAENITDQVFESVMTNSTEDIISLINSLRIPKHDINLMETIVEEAMQHPLNKKFARSNRYSFNNTSSFYKTLPESNYDVYDQDLYAGDEYLYDDMGNLSESDFDSYGTDLMADEFDGYSSDLMADEFDDYDSDLMADEFDDYSSDLMADDLYADDLYAGRRWRGERGKKYNKPPALDNSGCYSSKDWKGKGTPGQGTCYRLHNDYGSANSGKPGSKERAEYNRKWREQYSDSKSIKRKNKPGNNWK